MKGRKIVWCEKAGVKKCLEIVLIIMIISLAILWTPARALGFSSSNPSIDGAGEDKNWESDGDASSTEDTGMSETGYRIKPLQDRLEQMSAEAIEAYVNRYEDILKHTGAVRW